MLLSMNFRTYNYAGAHLCRIDANSLVIGERAGRKMICPGRIGGSAKLEIADYVLTFRNDKLALIEAKARDSAIPKGC
jgi:hypothetical protein